MAIVIFDAQGMTIKKWSEQLNNGTNLVSLQLGDLVSGIYFLTGTTDGNMKTNVVRIVKQ